MIQDLEIDILNGSTWNLCSARWGGKNADFNKAMNKGF